MVESEAVVPEAIIAQGKAAVIDYVVADILAVSVDTGKVATKADVLKRTGRLGAQERQDQSRPSLLELCVMFEAQLGISGGKTLADTVHLASAELRCSSIDGEALMDTAVRCWKELGSPRPHDAVGRAHALSAACDARENPDRSTTHRGKTTKLGLFGSSRGRDAW